PSMALAGVDAREAAVISLSYTRLFRLCTGHARASPSLLRLPVDRRMPGAAGESGRAWPELPKLPRGGPGMIAHLKGRLEATGLDHVV
ncbi:hypothetical protein, partial [Stenotrophomonas maltophilia]|uniref:hypothetical protein n=1 Tax=Stenotrophomonas maltophilia TaxID=40324 RepID=UPI0019549FF3